MATASKKPVTEFEVVLVLSKEEAETLGTITSLIGGDMLHSRRMHTDAIGEALGALGIFGDTSDVDRKCRSIYFNGEPE